MSQKNILYTLVIDGSRFIVKLLPNQPITRDFDRRPEDMKINLDYARVAKQPVGTVFLTNDYHFPEEGCLTLGSNFIPLFYEKTKHPILGGHSEEMQKRLDYVIDWMLNDDTYSEQAKDFAKHFETYGFKFDLEAKEKAITEAMASGKIPDGVNMRKAIATTYPCPKPEAIGFSINPDLWYLLVRNALRGISTLLIGPTGCGKTEILKHLTTALKRNLSIVDMGTVQDAQSALIGVHRLNDKGVSIFDPAPLVGYIQQENNVILLDEINRAPLSAANILFPLLDDRRYMPLDIAAEGEERHIPVGESVVFFATANLGSEYSGTNQVDRALMDRFFPVELSYPDEKAEIKILTKRTGVDEKSARAIVKVATQIRKQFTDQELSSTISVRHTLAAASLTADGFEVDQALTATILPFFEDSIGGTGERDKVKAMIAAF